MITADESLQSKLHDTVTPTEGSPKHFRTSFSFPVMRNLKKMNTPIRESKYLANVIRHLGVVSVVKIQNAGARSFDIDEYLLSWTSNLKENLRFKVMTF